MGKNGKLGKKSQLALAAKKCRPIGNYFMRKISATSVKYPLDVFVDDDDRKPPPETTGGGDVTSSPLSLFSLDAVITEAKREAGSATHRRASIFASDVPAANSSSSSSVATTINDENAPPNEKRAINDLRDRFLPLGQCRAMKKTTTNNNAAAAELLPLDDDAAMPSYYAAPKLEFGWGGDAASKKRSEQLIAVLENHREVICTVQ